MAMATSSALVVPAVPTVRAATLPAGFSEDVVFSGLTNPTVVRFSPDGRVFVAEKSGLIKVFDSLTDPTPTVFANLTTDVHNFWDRGLLGMALAPGFPDDPHVYALYTRDALPGGSSPRWGTAGAISDPCPTPPGANTDGCVVTGRLVRLQASGNVAVGAPQVLVEDWCNQYPSHSVGALQFGPDGALYASAGDGASFTFADYGQGGGSLSGTPTPRNPCGDPPGGVGDLLSPPTAEGGALRSQDLRTMPTSGGSYREMVTGLSPTAYWRLGETSGTTAAAVVGPGGTYRSASGGTLPTRGVPGLLTGDPDLAAAWTAAGQEVAIADSPALNQGTAVSVVAWINPSDWSGNRRIFQEGANDDGYQLFKDGSALRFQIAVPGGAHYSASTPTLPATGQRHLLVGTYERNGFIRLYVDGALIATNGPLTDAINVAPSGAAIGNKPGATFAGDQFAGTIDEVSVHNRALTGTEVQDLWTAGTTGSGSSAGDPVSLDGSIIRIDPSTGTAAAGNPLASSPDPMARRIVAYGLRNPFRFAFRPGTSEIWTGDVGWGTWEEINRVPAAADATIDNMGWPCYEGSVRAGYDAVGLALCENLYAAGPAAVLAPYYAYNHAAQVVPGEDCPAGSSSISGLAFYGGGTYPSTYGNALFFTDYSRDCIWVMRADASGLPQPGTIETFVAGAANPVHLEIGPGGDLFYVDFDGGTIRRIRFASANQPPTAVATATPSSGPAPLEVTLDGSQSSDPDPGTTLTYAWDLDNDGSFDDGTLATFQVTFDTAGVHPVRLRVTDPGGASATDTVSVSVNSTAPVPTIISPADGASWAVGDAIAVEGSATDAEDGSLPGSGLRWSVIMHHCPSNCHTHLVEEFTGATGSFNAPDHEYPSYLELRLTATDSSGLSASTSVQLDPRTVSLNFGTSPVGLSLTVNGVSGTAPFSRTVIAGSSNSLSAPASQIGPDSRTYTFTGWSDGGAATHNVTAGSTSATYVATYAAVAAADLSIEMSGSLAGDRVTYQITGRNLGPDTASTVVVSDTLTSRLTFVSASPGCTFTPSTLLVRCTASSLAPGARVDYQVVAIVGRGGRWLDNTATISSSTADPVGGNNSVTFRLSTK